MTENDKLQMFEDQTIRTAWDEEKEEWYFSVVDVVVALTESPDYKTGRKYWNKLKQRLKEEGNELVTNCHQLQFVKKLHHQAAQQPSAASKIQKYPPKACKQRRFHAQFASFFRFMAANLSLTHCVTRARPLMWV